MVADLRFLMLQLLWLAEDLVGDYVNMPKTCLYMRKIFELLCYCYY